MEFDITLKEKDIYYFSMYHTYLGSMQGVFSIVLAVLVSLIAAKTFGSIELMYSLLYFVFALVFLVYIPLTLKLRAKRQLKKSETLRKPLHFLINEDGVTVSQEQGSASLPWKQIYKMVSTKSVVLVYSNRMHAYIIPREQIGERYAQIRTMAKAQLEPFRVRMKDEVK